LRSPLFYNQTIQSAFIVLFQAPRHVLNLKQCMSYITFSFTCCLTCISKRRSGLSEPYYKGRSSDKYIQASIHL
jgi:hypothetical protein